MGYVVADLDAAVAELQRTLPLEVTIRETMEGQGVEAVMCEGGGGAVELIRPLDPEGAIARYMAKRGEGFHHVAFAVHDVEAALDELRGRGAELIDEHGAHRPRRARRRVRPPPLDPRRADRARSRPAATGLGRLAAWRPGASSSASRAAPSCG